MVVSRMDAATRRLDLYYATDCRGAYGPDGPSVATTIPIAADADDATVLLAQLRWASFVRTVAPRHTAAVAGLARSWPQ
jgi:hypothetical protein